MARLRRSNIIRENFKGILIGAAIVLGIAAAAWFFLGGSGGEDASPAPETSGNVYVCSDCGKEYVNQFPYKSPWEGYPTELPSHEIVDVDETYRNGSIAGATPVAMFQRVTGNLSSEDDVDFFSFVVDVPSSIHFRFRYTGNNNGYTYMWHGAFYGNGGKMELKAGLLPSEADEETSFDMPDMEPGTYYLKISAASGGNPFMNGYSDAYYHITFLPECAEHTETTVLRAAPACSQAGELVTACGVCDTVISTDALEPLDHIWSKWKKEKGISFHSLLGESSRTCFLCGEVETDPLLFHLFERGPKEDEKTAYDELCPANDIAETVCPVCGSVTAGGAEGGHTFSEWETTLAATCSAVGWQSRICVACGYREAKTVKPIPHAYGKAVRVSGSILDGPIVFQETCTMCGYVNTRESNWLWWLRPAIVVLGIAVAVVILVLALRVVRSPYMARKLRRWAARKKQGNRKKQEKTFLCPHCFRTSRRGEITKKAICPKCQKPLPESTLKGKDMIISVVGSRDTGKSHYIAVIINELITRIAPAFGGSFESFDDATIIEYEKTFRKPLYENAKKVSFKETDASDAYKPLIYSLKLPVKGFLREKVRLYTMVFFDSVGEDMQSEENMKTAERYIRESSGIIFLIDPLKIPSVNARLDKSVVERASSADWYHPDNILVRVSKLLREKDQKLRDTDKIKVPVSVVFTKFDVMEPNKGIVPEGLTIREPSPHCGEGAFNLLDGHNVNEEVKSLLRDWGAESFLTQLKMNYKSYSCFAVSSLGLHNNPAPDGSIDRPHPHRIEDPLLWLLMKRKVIKAKK